jgi:hypothetical protein
MLDENYSQEDLAPQELPLGTALLCDGHNLFIMVIYIWEVVWYPLY